VTALADWLALRAAGWDECDAFEAVTGPMAAEIERLRSRVVREAEPRALTPAQARALRALNRADVASVRGERLLGLRGRGDVRTQKALLLRGLITGKTWPAPQLTAAGQRWIEDNPECGVCGGDCRGSGAV
jgi:hypothetical protein